ncbi:PPR superfamily protein [Tasmannia lanceolata]|uniref:PPR superfamily protein n=1 Tax=Tasmannia lanceolata TaxID=3420 RepID=UPI00406477EA
MHCSIGSFTTTTTSPTLSAISRKIKEMVFKGLFEDTLKFYKELHSSKIHINSSLFPSLLKASSSAHSLHFSLQLHCILLKTGHVSEPITANSLISMYSKFSLVESAHQMFDKMPLRDEITWKSMIMCYIRNGYFLESVEMLKEMLNLGFEPQSELIASVVSVCGRMGDSRLGREIHGRFITIENISQSVYFCTALIDMYSRCNDLPTALRVFERMPERNEVSWTAIISGCVMNENYDLSLEIFRKMQVEGIKPNRVTLVSVLPSCTELRALRHGKEIHGYVFRHGFCSDSHINGAVMDMYCKCEGTSRPTLLVFERVEKRDIVIWSSMIRSFSRNGESTKAFNFFYLMQMEGIKPNSVTILAIITACIGLSSMDHGQGVHGYILKSGLNSDMFVGNSLIAMYSKCGCLDASHQVFEEMPTKDTVSWSSMILCYGLHVCGSVALQLFHEMQGIGIKPDQITFLAVLSACNHAGLVDEGRKLFNYMIQEYGIAPNKEHYACLVDLLGRSGKLEEACAVIRSLPVRPSPSMWSSLVSACKVHGRLEVAEMLAQHLIDSEPENAANYTLLSMIHAETSNWAAIEEVRRVMRERGLKKMFGFSRIEIENRVYS